jgi:hypothetical protein
MSLSVAYKWFVAVATLLVCSVSNAETIRQFDRMGKLYLNSHDEFISIPILAESRGLVFEYRDVLKILSEDIEILAVTTTNLNAKLESGIAGNTVHLVWSNEDGIRVEKGDILISLVLKINHHKSLKRVPPLIKYEKESRRVIVENRRHDPYFGLALPRIVIDDHQPILVLDSLVHPEGELFEEVTKITSVKHPVSDNLDVLSSKIINIIPNPAVIRADIIYSIAEEDAIVTTKLYNLLGVEVMVLIDGERRDIGVFRRTLPVKGLSNGLYILRMEVASNGRKESIIEKIVVKQ